MSALNNSEHWVTFFGFKPGCPDLQGEVTIRMREPIELFDEPECDGEGSGISEFTRCRALAKGRLKKQLGLHPCNTLKGWHFAPCDWSDSIDEMSSK